MTDTDSSRQTAMGILVSISLCHLLNDMLQILVPSIYPVIAQEFALDFTRVGLITLVHQLMSSVLQPLVGLYNDRHPRPYALVAGMAATLAGVVLLSRAASYPALLAAVALMGLGNSILHPESSRVARMASGGQHGLAQSLFQLGGNFGSALGPLLAVFVVLPLGRGGILWLSGAALVGIVLLFQVARWSTGHAGAPGNRTPDRASRPAVSHPRAVLAVTVLLTLLFSKFFYMASMSNFFTFYLMSKFGIGTEEAQLRLFIFMGAVAAGTIIGGPVGDRIGRKRVIWGSILGVLPFTLLLPHANLWWTGVLTIPIGLILASAFSAIVVYGQELLPNRVGTVAGLMMGFAFGMGGIGASVLGWLADQTGIDVVYHLCSFLPLLGLLTAFLPDIERKRGGEAAQNAAA
ncbi:MAG: MFS transporter [Telmatospirillum sp.]|nr:MFS transporter [Telmatospirillum sp.]